MPAYLPPRDPSTGRFMKLSGLPARSKLGVRVEGLEKLKAALKSKEAKYHKGIEVGMKRAGLLLQRYSQKVVPVDTGALRASANTRAEGVGIDTQVFVSYGTEYAVYVHENLKARHAEGKRAKYLSGPAEERRQELTQTVVNAVRNL